MKTIDCSNRGLKRIPQDLPTDVEAIFLQNNSITMHVGIKQMPQLRLLDLSHNAIQGFFGRLSLPQLEHLFISYNPIPRVTSGDNDFFALLRNLQTLSLRGNGIYSIDSETLELPRLKVLDLAHNNLATVKESVFAGLHNLNYLDLSYNNLTDTSVSTVFNGMELQILNLSGNGITSLVTEHLKVDLLDLSNNSFRSLKKDSIGGFHAQHLILNSLPFLWQIAAMSFVNVKGVKKLDMSKNFNLIYIEDGAFVSLSNLTHVSLDGSRLIKLPQELMDREDVDLSTVDVPLMCHLNNQFILSSKNNATCVWMNRTLTADDLKNFVNTDDWRRTPPVIVPSFPTTINAELGSVLEVQCFTSGSAAQIIWNRVDERWKREYPVQSFSGVLKLGPLYRVDSGKYMCKAYNEFGLVNRSVQVNVTYAPVVIIPLSCTHQYLTFAWNNSDPSIASQFRLMYFEKTGGNFTHIRTIFMEHLVRTYTIGNLKPGTTYQICLFLNKSGNIEELDCKNMTTKTLEITG